MIAVALTLLLSIPAGSQDINSQVKTQKDKLNQIQREIERHRSESAKLKRQEKDVAKQLELLDKGNPPRQRPHHRPRHTRAFAGRADR